VHATLGRGFFVLLNGHDVTPKKSARLTLETRQCRKRIGPFAGLGGSGQATFFVPRGHRQTEQDFILNQLKHIQFTHHRQEIPGVVFQLVLRQIGTFGNKFQPVIDLKIERNGLQATLASQGNSPRNLHFQHWFATRTFEPTETEMHFSRHLDHQIVQPLKRRQRQHSFKNAPLAGKNESVCNLFQSQAAST